MLPNENLYFVNTPRNIGKVQKISNKHCFNPVVPNAPFLYPLKISENLMFF